MPLNQHEPRVSTSRLSALILAFRPKQSASAPPSGCAQCGVVDGCECPSEIERRRRANELLVQGFTGRTVPEKRHVRH